MTTRALAALAAVILFASVAPRAHAEDAERPSDSSAVTTAPVPDVHAEQLGSLRTHGSPGEAFAVGLMATATPVVLAANTRSRWGNDGPDPFAVVLGSTLGVTVGPSLGLWWGGRQDLASRGLLLRSACIGVTLLSLVGAAGAYNGSSDGSASGMLAIATLGAGVTCVSALHDLAITPSAVADGRPRASLGVTPNGMLAATVRF